MTTKPSWGRSKTTQVAKPVEISLIESGQDRAKRHVAGLVHEALVPKSVRVLAIAAQVRRRNGNVEAVRSALASGLVDASSVLRAAGSSEIVNLAVEHGGDVGGVFAERRFDEKRDIGVVQALLAHGADALEAVKNNPHFPGIAELVKLTGEYRRFVEASTESDDTEPADSDCSGSLPSGRSVNPAMVAANARSFEEARAALIDVASHKAFLERASSDPVAMEWTLRMLNDVGDDPALALRLARTPVTLAVVLDHCTLGPGDAEALIADRAVNAEYEAVLLKHGIDPVDIVSYAPNIEARQASLALLRLLPLTSPASTPDRSTSPGSAAA